MSEANIAAAERLIAAYNARDFETVAAMIVEDLDFIHHNRGIAMKSGEEFLGLLRHFAADVMPDRGFDTAQRVTASGDLVIREARWSGTAQIAIPDLCEAEERVSYCFCTILRFGPDGRVVQWSDYG